MERPPLFLTDPELLQCVVILCFSWIKLTTTSFYRHPVQNTITVMLWLATLLHQQVVPVLCQSVDFSLQESMYQYKTNAEPFVYTSL